MNILGLSEYKNIIQNDCNMRCINLVNLGYKIYHFSLTQEHIYLHLKPFEHQQQNLANFLHFPTYRANYFRSAKKIKIKILFVRKKQQTCATSPQHHHLLCGYLLSSIRCNQGEAEDLMEAICCRSRISASHRWVFSSP